MVCDTSDSNTVNLWLRSRSYLKLCYVRNHKSPFLFAMLSVISRWQNCLRCIQGLGSHSLGTVRCGHGLFILFILLPIFRTNLSYIHDERAGRKSNRHTIPSTKWLCRVNTLASSTHGFGGSVSNFRGWNRYFLLYVTVSVKHLDDGTRCAIYFLTNIILHHSEHAINEFTISWITLSGGYNLVNTVFQKYPACSDPPRPPCGHLTHPYCLKSNPSTAKPLI